MEIQETLNLVLAERQRQELLMEEGKIPWTCADWSVAPAHKLVVLTEEVGEVARAIQELWARPSKKNRAHLREELVQVASVVVAWLESME